HVPVFAGKHIYKVAPDVLDALGTHLLSHEKIVHSYPHSWRSKTPLIYRTTPQWFVSMDENHLREKALKAIDEVKWIPESSINRIKAMVSGRPDWCISRQRAWGVPITIFVDKKTGEPLRDTAVMERIVNAVKEGSSDVWYNTPAQDFLGPDYRAEDFEQVQDIL